MARADRTAPKYSTDKTVVEGRVHDGRGEAAVRLRGHDEHAAVGDERAGRFSLRGNSVVVVVVVIVRQVETVGTYTRAFYEFA